MSIVLSVESLSKRFRFQRNRPRTLKEAITLRLTGRYDPAQFLWALRDVSFQVFKGRTLGVIGHNGAGKSTLLRLLCGVGKPTSGTFQATGEVRGLLELGSGFHPLMTGRENIRTAGILNGLTKRQVDQLEDKIIAFAELEDFIDEPVRTYSSGMVVRLGFAVAVQMEPDILMIDEVLAVGDVGFRKKCLTRLKDFQRAGKTLVIVSHELEQIEVMSNEVLVLEEGRVAFQGDPLAAVEHYQMLLRQRTESRAADLAKEMDAVPKELEEGKFGTQEAQITDVSIYDQKGNRVDMIPTGSEMNIEIDVRLMSSLSDFAISLGIFSEKEVKCFETNVGSVRNVLGTFNGSGRFRCRIPNLHLLPGRYFVNVGIFPPDWGYIYDYHSQVHHFYVSGEVPNVFGIVSVRPSWSTVEP